MYVLKDHDMYNMLYLYTMGMLLYSYCCMNHRMYFVIMGILLHIVLNMNLHRYREMGSWF